MMKKWVFTLLLAMAGATQAGELPRQLTLPTGLVITLEQGSGEPASIGSYALRLYSGSNPRFPLDDFIAGIIMPRNGSLVAARLVDLNDDKQPELIVVAQSAGSGGYLSADAFTVTPEGIESYSQVMDLPPDSDLVKALRAPQE